MSVGVELPSSESLRKPLIISLVILLVLLIAGLALSLIVRVMVGGAMTTQEKQAVYQRSENFMTHVYQESSQHTYNAYMSSLVQNSDKDMTSWNHMVSLLQEDKLVSVSSYKDQKGQFYKATGSTAPKAIRYGVNLKMRVNLNGTVKPVQAKLEWIKQNGQLKLFLLQVPFEVGPSGKFHTVHYGLKHVISMVN